MGECRPSSSDGLVSPWIFGGTSVAEYLPCALGTHYVFCISGTQCARVRIRIHICIRVHRYMISSTPFREPFCCSSRTYLYSPSAPFVLAQSWPSWPPFDIITRFAPFRGRSCLCPILVTICCVGSAPSHLAYHLFVASLLHLSL